MFQYVSPVKNFLYLISILLITIYIYSAGLNGPLLFDDHINLEPLKNLENDLVSWTEVLRSSPHGNDRPVSILSFIINWKITGDNVWYLKLTNLLIHLLCGVLIFCLSYILLNKKNIFTKNNNTCLALFIMSAWLLSPYQVSTVLYVIQRMAQLSGLFMLAAILCYVTGRNRIEAHEIKRGIILIIIAILFFWPLSFLSKQNSAVLPLVLLFIEIFFYGENSTYSNKLKLLLSLFIIIPVLFVFYYVFLNPEWIAAGYSGRDFTLYERLITQPRILFDYASNLLLLPGGSPMGLFHDDYIKSTGIFSPPETIISIISLLIILFLCVIYRKANTGIILFGVIFFLSTHLVESTFLPLELYFEHRNYLPGFGLYFALGSGIGFLLNNRKYSKLTILIMLILLTWFSILTYHRASIWQNIGEILHTSVVAHPGSWRAQTRIANLSILNGERDIAYKHLDKALQINDTKGKYGIVLSQLIAHCYSNEIPQEKLYLNLENTRLLDDTYTFSILRWFNQLLNANECGNLDKERIIYTISGSLKNEKAKHLAKLWELNLYVGQFYSAINDDKNALTHYLKAYELNDSYYDAAILALELQISMSEYESAKSLLNRIDQTDSYKYSYQRKIFEKYKLMIK